MSIEPDFYANATLISGLPTVVVPPKPYHRTITNIIVGNSVPSGVSVYRGLLGSVPVAQNSQGNNNTISGVINLAAGQQLFVVWSATGAPVSSAFARVSSERTDSPLGGSATAESQTWTTNPVTLITVASPTADGARVEIGGQNTALTSFYQNNFVPGTPYTVISALIFYDGQISGLPTGEFYYEALVYTASTVAKAYTVTGRFAGGNVTQYTQQKVLGPTADPDIVFTPPNGFLIGNLTWTAFPYANGWTDHLGGYRHLMYMKMPWNAVWLLGTAQSPNPFNATMGTMPAGYIPVDTQPIGTTSDNLSETHLEIDLNGVVTVVGDTTVNRAWFVNGLYTLDT